MIGRAEARTLAEQHLLAMKAKWRGPEVVLLDDATLEQDFGWVFFWQSRAFVETGDLKDSLIVNAPLVARRSDGQILETGTAYPVEHYIAELRRQGML